MLTHHYVPDNNNEVLPSALWTATSPSKQVTKQAKGQAMAISWERNAMPCCAMSK